MQRKGGWLAGWQATALFLFLLKLRIAETDRVRIR